MRPGEASPSPASPCHGVKRKADTQDNERLSKRLSLLNLEHDGAKLYVPVETPPRPPPPSSADSLDEAMRLDDSSHKVYIYNIDDELSSDDEGPDDAKQGELVFLRDIDRHLRVNRIPPRVLAGDDGQLAGMQLVLYSDPKSLSVPEHKDGVRKAILESRRRLRGEGRPDVPDDAVHRSDSRVPSPPSTCQLDDGPSQCEAGADDDPMELD